MHMTHMIDVKYPLMNVTSDNLMHMTHDPCELAIITLVMHGLHQLGRCIPFVTDTKKQVSRDLPIMLSGIEKV